MMLLRTSSGVVTLTTFPTVWCVLWTALTGTLAYWGEVKGYGLMSTPAMLLLWISVIINLPLRWCQVDPYRKHIKRGVFTLWTSWRPRSSIYALHEVQTLHVETVNGFFYPRRCLVLRTRSDRRVLAGMDVIGRSTSRLKAVGEVLGRYMQLACMREPAANDAVSASAEKVA